MKSATDLAANAIAENDMQKHPDLFALLDKHLVDFITNRKDASDLKYAHDAFVQPVMTGIVANGFYTIPVALAIANHLYDATEVYHEILMQMSSLRDEFDKIADLYAASNEKLKNESEQLLHDFFTNIK